MIQKLKTYLQNKDTDKTIAFIQEHPEILEFEDENKSTGFMIIAYSGQESVLVEAITLKKSFSFHEAIIAGKMEKIKEYLIKEKEVYLNQYSNDGFTPIALATFFNQTDIAKLLLEHGADPELSAKNPSKVNALHSAVAKENYELAKLFIEKGINVNAVQMQNVTALHSAVHRGNLKLVQLLMENGANKELTMDNGDTALLIAKREKHKSIEKYLSNH